MKDWTVGEFFASVAALAFILTVAYVYGYSLSLGINLLPYFSLDDYLRLSITWLALTSVLIALCILPSEFLETLTTRRRVRDADAVPSSPATKRIRVPSDVLFVLSFLFVLTVLSIIMWLNGEFTPHVYLLWGITGGLIWLALAKRYLARIGAANDSPKLLGLIFVILPTFVIMSFSVGLANGAGAQWLLPKRKPAEIHLKGEPKALSAVVLLSLGEFLVLRGEDPNSVQLIPKEQVRAVVENLKDGV